MLKYYNSPVLLEKNRKDIDMRIIVYGAGAIGSDVGGYLAKTGQDVILIGRQKHVKAINAKGLKLITSDNIYTLKIPAVTGPGEIEFQPDDVVFLCMKGQHTEKAVEDLKKSAPDIPVFCFQNGIRNEEIVLKSYPKVYGVMVTVGARYTSDGEVISLFDSPGLLIMGKYPAGKDELLESVAAVLHSAGFTVTVTDDIMPFKWGKLIDNLGNAVDAITSANREDLTDIIKAVRDEAREILAQAKIGWKPQHDVLKEYPSIMPPKAVKKFEGSTWQSLHRKQGSVETGFLNGEIIRVANRLGLKAPLNEKLQNIVEQMAVNREVPGKYTPAQLRELLGI
jgi:2-dehydropantoate 2-reductase